MKALGLSLSSALALIAASVLALSATPALGANSPTLYFKSGFEPPVALSAAHKSGSIASQEFSGGDQGFNWPPTFWNGSLIMQDLVSSSLDMSRYVDNHLETTTGHNGAPTTALYQKVIALDSGNTQAPMYYMPKGETSDLYVRYWLKFQPNLGSLMGAHYWRSVFEFKTSGDYRFAFDVHTDGNGNPYWFAHGDNNANGPYSYQEFWNVNNSGVPVPQGQWFSLEVFWHRAHDSTGRIWTAVNGQTVVDHSGNNYGVASNPINRIMLTQVYGKAGYYQWVDDMEIWSGIPSSTTTTAAVSQQPAPTPKPSQAPANPVVAPTQPKSSPTAAPPTAVPTPPAADPPTAVAPNKPGRDSYWQARLAGFWRWIVQRRIHYGPISLGTAEGR